VARTLRSTSTHASRTVSSGRTVRPPRELPELDRLIHERLRLGIVSALAINDSLSFNDLKRVLKTSDGNLSVHAQKLEAAGYLRCNKFFQGRIPRTEYRLTPAGRKALETYLEQMERFIAQTREQV
jgi:DNA-binding HxlR family transcriptional regulator